MSDAGPTLKDLLDDLYLLLRDKRPLQGRGNEDVLYRLDKIYQLLGCPRPGLPQKQAQKPPPATLGPLPNKAKAKPGLS